jgi:hypothetical protein
MKIRGTAAAVFTSQQSCQFLGRTVVATVHFDRLLGWHGACKVVPSILQVSMLNKSGETKDYMADVKGWPG